MNIPAFSGRYDRLFGMSGTVSHRIVTVGNTAVGKTAIINQYIYGSSSSEHQPTVGIDFFGKTVKVGSRVVRLQL
jgi:GTPase SAR1 family protein